jgi:soluble lytic murein transglycosylase-like protein
VELARNAARKYALPDAFVARVMRAESGFNPAAVSPKGAIGLMQLMPDTARDLGVDPRNPDQNADAGTRYLRDLLARYEDRPDQVELALAAYNAGPAAVDKYHGVPPYRETREYILRVLKSWNAPAVAAPGAKDDSK